MPANARGYAAGRLTAGYGALGAVGGVVAARATETPTLMLAGGVVVCAVVAGALAWPARRAVAAGSSPQVPPRPAE